MSNFIPMVYAVLKDRGVDTKGMSADEAVEKYNELTGKSGVYDTESGEEKGTASESKPQEISSLLGKEYTGVKGQAAVEKLLREKQGYIKGAFHRDDIGDIALVWGNEKFGLQHIVKRRTEQGMDAVEFLSDLTDVVEQGRFAKTNGKGRYEVYQERKVAVIEPDKINGKITMLITAFKRRKEPR